MIEEKKKGTCGKGKQTKIEKLKLQKEQSITHALGGVHVLFLPKEQKDTARTWLHLTMLY